MKEKTKSKLWRLTKIILVVLIIWVVYNMGMMRGLILGIYASQEKQNKTVCDVMELTRDDDGFCLLRNDEQKYRYYLDCGWEKFKIEGKEKPPFILQIGEDIKRIILYPATGC